MDRKIGAQYYTLRDYAKTIEDFDDTCRKVSEMGYKIVQISGTPLGAAEMKEVLDKYDLKVVVTHRNFNDFKNNLDEIIEYNKTLGCYLCGVGAMPGEARESVEGLDQFIKDANEISAKLKKEGLYFGYHNHHFEFAKLDGKLIMDRLINETNPDEFMFIVDTYWLQFGGGKGRAERGLQRHSCGHFGIPQAGWRPQLPFPALLGKEKARPPARQRHIAFLHKKTTRDHCCQLLRSRVIFDS